jgi:hypothetical protein
MQPDHGTAFQQHILSGEFTAALALLPLLTSSEEVLRQTRFSVLEQQYLESLEADDVKGALACLRTQMSPLHVDQQRLHHLASER